MKKMIIREAYEKIVEEAVIEWYELFESDLFDIAIADELNMAVDTLRNDQTYQEFCDDIVEEL